MNLKKILLGVLLCCAVTNLEISARRYCGGRGYYGGGWGGWGYPYGGFGIGYNYGPYGGWGGPYWGAGWGWGGGYWGGPVIAPTVVIPIGGGDNSPEYVQPQSNYVPYQDRQGSQEWIVSNNTDKNITFNSNHGSSQTIIPAGQTRSVSHRQSFLFNFSAPGSDVIHGETEDHHINITSGMFGGLKYTTDNK